MLDMMSFKKEFVSLCRSALCESGTADMAIEERKVNKAQRGMLNGILFTKEGLDCAPTYYIEDFYREYRHGTPIADLSHDVVENAILNLRAAGDLARKTLDLIMDKENLGVRLLNKNRNKEYLKGIPYRELGCGFVYIAQIEHFDYVAVITDDLLKEYGMSKDELFGKAILNTMEKHPAVLHDLAESAMSGITECENLLEGPAGRAPAEAGPGFVLTNSRFFWGAGALFYPGVADRIHELVGGDFYVLPSSVHELIIIPAEDQNPQNLADMVRSANRSVVEERDILADDLYICESGRLRRVSYGGTIPLSGDLVC